MTVKQSYYQKNKEYLKARSRAWRKKNPKRLRFYTKRWAKNNPERRRASYERWKKKHPGMEKVHSKRYYAKNTKKVIRRTARWRKRNPEQYKAYNLKRYGITINEFETFRKAQNNRCRICQRKFDKSPTVDHSHKSGAIRGLLCGQCNTGLGMFKDSVKSLAAAIQYLKETER